MGDYRIVNRVLLEGIRVASEVIRVSAEGIRVSAVVI